MTLIKIFCKLTLQPLDIIKKMEQKTLINNDSESPAMKRIVELRKIYDERQQDKKAKILMYGEWGTYKTTLATTMPRPILMHSFDPGGDKIKHIQDGVRDGSIIVDNKWQSRTMTESGDLFQKWNNEYSQLKNDKVFDEIGTFVLDSLTTLQRLVVDASVESNTKNRIVSSKMPVKVPQMRDYGVQDSAMEFVLADILSLPCHVLIIGHAEQNENTNSKGEITSIEYRPLIVGKKLRGKIPLLFDEIYITATQGNKGVMYTQPSGMYHARSRLGSLFPIQKKYDNKEIGDLHLTRDILVPAGYAKPEEIIQVS